jgi:hypothetical protein
MFSAGIVSVLPAVKVSPTDTDNPPEVWSQWSKVCAVRVGTSEVTVIEDP